MNAFTTLVCCFVAALGALLVDRLVLQRPPSPLDNRQLCMLTMPDGNGGAKIVPLNVDENFPMITSRVGPKQ